MQLTPSNQRFNKKPKKNLWYFQCQLQEFYGKKFVDSDVFFLDKDLIQATEHTLTKAAKEGLWVPTDMDVFEGGILLKYDQGPVVCYLETFKDNGQILWSLGVSINLENFEKKSKKLSIKLQTLVSEKKQQGGNMIQFEWQDQTLEQVLSIMGAFLYKESHKNGKIKANIARKQQ